jgi:hypothetical protein
MARLTREVASRGTPGGMAALALTLAAILAPSPAHAIYNAAESATGRKRGSRFRSCARRLGAATGVGVALVAVAAAPAALGAAPQVNHFRDIGSDVGPDFCGTGKQINVAFNIRVNEWLAPHQGDFKSTASGTATFTNPLTGDMVTERFVGQFLGVTVSGDPAGINVHEFTVKGLPELFKTPHGGVLIRDAGYILFRVVFDGEMPLSSEIVVNKGPHPLVDGGGELFCQIMVGALGL